MYVNKEPSLTHGNLDCEIDPVVWNAGCVHKTHSQNVLYLTGFLF